MLAEPDRVETGVLDRSGKLEQLRPTDLALDLRQLDSDSNGTRHPRIVACHT